MKITCPDNFVDGYVGGIQLLCKLMDCLCRVLIGMRINISPETWKFYYRKQKAWFYKVKFIILFAENTFIPLSFINIFLLNIAL